MTYAKSGTNWVMQIVWQLIHHCEKDFDHIHSVAPWPDAVLDVYKRQAQPGRQPVQEHGNRQALPAKHEERGYGSHMEDEHENRDRPV